MPQAAAPAPPAGRALAWLGAGAFVVSLAYFAYAYVVVFGRVTRPAPEGLAEVAGPAVANLALFSVFALHHSVMARTGAKQWLSRRLPPSLERTSYVWISSVLFLWTCAWWQEVPGVAWTLPWPWSLAGRAAQLAGAWLTLRSAGVLDIWDLSGIRQAHGHPVRPQFKVVGPYHWVRHPIYFGWVLLTFGTPEMTATRLTFALISSAYLAVAVPFEERTLVEVFGEEYRQYQRRVRWRMLPGIY
jgi:methanethiol S-methyltransferase